ncbi:unnamed protein product [Meloidogyne enterolobii]|uniref:Uncharacterized protein n=1 Tax=Meloidogyne enterolobii TaxID=390850 RepID=A0ACB1ABL4_MELEN
MENYWGKFKEKLISKYNNKLNIKIENELHYFLIEILKVTEGKLNKEALSKIKENLYLEKISKYFVDFNKINWSVLNANQRQFVKEILNLQNNENLNEWILKIEKRIEELKQIKEQVEIDNSGNMQVYLHPDGFRPLNKNWHDLSSNVHHNDITPIKSFNELFEKWKDEKSKQIKEISNFQLFMSPPLNKEGGHIHAIVLAIGAGKVEYKIIKGLFIDESSKSLTLFNSTCSDDSLYCHLFKVK